MNISRHRLFSGHQGSVYALARVSNTSFISAGSDGVIAQWNTEDEEDGIMLARVPGIIYSLCLSDNNQLLCGTSSGGIHIIDLNESAEKRLLQFHDSPVFAVYHLREHKLICSLGGNGWLHVADENFNPLKKLQLSKGKLRSLAVHPSGNSFVVGTAEGMIHQVSLPELEHMHEWLAHKPGFSINTLCYSPDGSTLLSGSRDACINISDVKDYTQHRSIPAHNYAIYTVAFRPDDHSVFATASRDKTIKLWNADEMEVIARIDAEKYNGHLNSVNVLVWLDKNTFITAGDDRSVIAWKINSI